MKNWTKSFGKWLKRSLRGTGKAGSSEEGNEILLLPKDPNDERTLLLKSEAVPGEMRLPCLPEICSGCIPGMPREMGGKRKYLIPILRDRWFQGSRVSIEGNGAYSRLKFESGVHRVQRVPVTEANGRVHTSTVTVAVLPEAEEIDVEINPNDLRIDTYRASGAGGQHINKPIRP